ncbi:S41 family peptidase [Flavobacterium ardleyense]|uniref:S41 family peptidase n=1 Tax=Flavobacterium ardleyense TaxID=2038737 RepID=A0ABW5Z5W6_9FLAO
MKKFIVFAFIFQVSILFSQGLDYNLNFDNPALSNWVIDDENQNFKFDKVQKVSGSQSLLLTDPEQKGNGISNVIRGSFEGESIRLKIYLKTEDVKQAFIYLIVGTDKVEKYFNLGPTLEGTNDWKAYEVTLPYTPDCDKITIAANFSGGQIWLDNASLEINEIAIENLKPGKFISVERENSGFKLKNNLSKNETKNLFLLGKIWGYLKYYHPTLTSNSKNWDNELFDNLPLIYSMNFEKDVLNWVKKLEEGEITKYDFSNNNFKQAGNLGWIDKGFKTADLKRVLLNVANFKREIKQYTVTSSEESGLSFQNEFAYESMNSSDDGIKILALFRFWNAIEYWYPYKNLISKNWDDVLMQFIPKIVATKTELDYALCLNELVVQIEDTHGMLFPNELTGEYFGNYSLSINTKFIKDKLVVTHAMEESNLIAGDILTSIDGKSIASLKADLKKYNVASNDKTTLRNLATEINRTNKDDVKLGIERNGKKVQLISKTIKLNEVNSASKNSYEINEKIGYLNAENASVQQIDSLFQSWNNKKAILIDLRNYPKENIAFVVSRHLHKKEFVVFQATEAKLEYPGYFAPIPEIKLDEFISPAYEGLIYVLVDENSQSKAEFSAMVLQSYHKTKVIGSQTAGTDGAASFFILPGNYTAYFTTQGMYYSDWKPAQKIGIVPDVNIESTLIDIKKGTDAVLNKAIELANQ